MHLILQKVPLPRRMAQRLLKGMYGAAWLLGLSVAWSQEMDVPAGGGRLGLQISPSLSVSERYSSNAKQVSTRPQSEFVTQISPGVSIRSNTSRIKGNLDYSLNANYYANGTSGNDIQNALNTNWRVEAVEGWAFLDASAIISQQSISAFGTKSVDSVFNSNNSTETLNYRFSPYVRGEFAGGTGYEARLNFSGVNADAQAASDLRTSGGQLRVTGKRSGALVWSVDTSRTKSKFSLGRTTENNIVQGRLDYVLSSQANVFLTLGRESNNFSSLSNQNYPTSGVGFLWRLNERTKLDGQIERRSFGHSHNLSFEHRTGRTSWRFSDVQGVSNTADQAGVTAVGTLAQLLSIQFEALEPDPVRRAELVNNYLLANGYNPNTPVLSNFIASSASKQRRQEISAALTGIRDTVTFSYSRSSNRQLGNVVSAFDDFSTSDLIQQTGFIVSYSHRLTRDAALSVGVSRQNTAGVQGSLGTSLKALDVTLSGRLGRQLFATLGLRRAQFDSTTSPYSETGVTGALNMRF